MSLVPGISTVNNQLRIPIRGEEEQEEEGGEEGMGRGGDGGVTRGKGEEEDG